jgi:hypothetical protein
MATYLQGVTDFIPQVQPFQPDLNFYGGLMQAKQNQYDQNWNSLNKMYGQYFYADLTRDKNIEKKDEYLKDIEFNLKRVSGLDLSLEQNVTQATQVFKPFYEDKFLMKDMALTKNYMTQRAKGEGLRNSSNEEMRKQYWGTGIKYMDYKREEFKNTTDEESMSFGNINYTPYVNTMEKALKIAKDADLNVETVDFSSDGKWIVKKKNGQALEEPLQKLFEAMLGSDPGIQDVYRTQSYVNRKDYSHGNAAQFGGDRDAAEMDYLQTSYEALKTLNERRVKALEDQERTYKSKSNVIKQQQENGNITTANNSYLENLREAMGINTTVLEQAEVVQGTLSDGNGTVATSSGFENPYGDIASLRQKVDAGMASYLMQKDLGEAAHVFSFRNAGIDMEANPFEMLRIREAGADRRAQAKIKADRDNIKLNNLIKTGSMIEVPKFDRDGNVVSIDYEINKKAFEIHTVVDPVSGMAAKGNKDVLATQIAEHYQLETEKMVGDMSGMMNTLLKSKIMSDVDRNWILNGVEPLGPMINTEPGPMDWLDRLTGKKEGGYIQSLIADMKKRNTITYDSPNDFNKDFAGQDLYYDTERLSAINNRFSDWALKNNALLEGDVTMQTKLQNYYRSSADYNDYISIMDGYQGFKKDASGEIITYLKDNDYKYADLFFDANGDAVGVDVFKERLKSKGVIGNVLKREVSYQDPGAKWNEWNTITNENFDYHALKLGKQRMQATNGSGLVSHIHKAGEVTLYKADGTIIKLPGNKVRSNVSDDSQYVSHMTHAGGYGASDYDLYEVNDGNRESVQRRVGENWIFGKIGGGLAAYHSGEDTFQDEYDKLAIAVSDTWANSNVVKAKFEGVPNFSSGVGVAAFERPGISVLPKGYGTPGNVWMNQTIDNINRIDWDGHRNVISNSLEESGFNNGQKEGEDGMTLTEKGQLLYTEFARSFQDPTSDIKPFDLEASGVAAGDQLKAAMIIRVPADFIDEYTQKVTAKGAVPGSGMLTPEEAALFKKNGLVFMSDRDNFNNGLFENIYVDPFEMSVKYNNGYTYEHPSGVGTMNIIKNDENLIGDPYTVNIDYKIFDINTGKDSTVNYTDVMGSLTQDTRNVFVKKLDMQRLLNIQNENIYYGRQ